MVGQFKVLDTVRQRFAATATRAEQVNNLLICFDEGECPMRQMPRYLLDPEQGEVEKFGGSQLNGKSIKIEIREMFGKGNPTMRGRVIGPVNGK